jgi:hypothetical protein
MDNDEIEEDAKEKMEIIMASCLNSTYGTVLRTWYLYLSYLYAVPDPWLDAAS